MELRHLRYFVTAAEELNISRASARLRVSQPAVSRQIHDLEEELGVALFKREKNGLSLTEAGESYLAHARDILRKSVEAVTHMNSFRKKAAKKLTVGYIAPALATILTPALRRFERTNAETEISLKELSPNEQVKALRDGRIDLALLGNPCAELGKEFQITVLRRIPFQAVLPDNHLLADRKRLALSELKDETFIGFIEESFPGRNAAICAACQQVGFTPRLRHRVGSLSALLAMVATGRGVTLAPAEVSQLPHPQAVFVALKPPTASVASAAAFRKSDKNVALLELLALCKSSK
ncbi:MAG: LysR substrate-binding domain-containing protein [Verrucomicrobiota bacterium]